MRINKISQPTHALCRIRKTISLKSQENILGINQDRWFLRHFVMPLLSSSCSDLRSLMTASSKSERSSLPTALVRDHKAILSLCTSELTVFSLFGWLNNHGNILSGLALTSPSNLLQSLYYHFLTFTNQVTAEPSPSNAWNSHWDQWLVFPHTPFPAA